MKVIIGQLKERTIPSVGNGMIKEWHSEEVAAGVASVLVHLVGDV